MRLKKYKKNKQAMLFKPIFIKLHNFITNFILLMEEELEELKLEKTKNRLGVKKNIADILNKLITFLNQLNRMNKSEQLDEEEVMSPNDQEIISRFLKKNYKNNN